jgi:hypothetical protein
MQTMKLSNLTLAIGLVAAAWAISLALPAPAGATPAVPRASSGGDETCARP